MRKTGKRRARGLEKIGQVGFMNIYFSELAAPPPPLKAMVDVVHILYTHYNVVIIIHKKIIFFYSIESEEVFKTN